VPRGRSGRPCLRAILPSCRPLPARLRVAAVSRTSSCDSGSVQPFARRTSKPLAIMPAVAVQSVYDRIALDRFAHGRSVQVDSGRSVAKLRFRLEGRPPSTMAVLFSVNDFSLPTEVFTQFASPLNVLLWGSSDLDVALPAGSMTERLRQSLSTPSNMDCHSTRSRGVE